jgi:hypothetical protein
MYFPLFGKSEWSPLSDDLTYIVESLVTQMLTNADPDTLQTMLRAPCFVDMILDELDFLRQVPKSELPQIRDYLLQEAPTLIKNMERMASYSHALG